MLKSRDITIKKHTSIATQERLWLLNINNGRIVQWMPYLAVMAGFVDCTADGQPINPSDIPGNHPWIKQTTQGLHDQLEGAGADENTLYQVGQQLTADASAKFRQLAYDKAESIRIESKGNPIGPLIRIYKRIDRNVSLAKIDLWKFSMEIRERLGID